MHTYTTAIYDDSMDEEKLEKKMLKDAARFASENVDRRENPCGSYHGDFRKRSDRLFVSEDEAKDFLGYGDYKDGWVRFKEYKSCAESKKAEKKIEDLRSHLSAYEKKTREDFKNRKSEFVGCKKCGSKLALKYIPTTICPLCRNDLRSDSVKAKIEDYYVRIKTAEDEYEEAKKKGKWEIKALAKFEVHC